MRSMAATTVGGVDTNLTSGNRNGLCGTAGIDCASRDTGGSAMTPRQRDTPSQARHSLRSMVSFSFCTHERWIRVALHEYTTPGVPVVAPDVRHQGRGTTAYQTWCAVSCPPEAPLGCLVNPCSLLPQLCELRHKLGHLPPCQGLPGRTIRIMRRHVGAAGSNLGPACGSAMPVEPLLVRQYHDGYQLLRIGKNTSGGCRSESIPLKISDTRLVATEVHGFVICDSPSCDDFCTPNANRSGCDCFDEEALSGPSDLRHAHRFQSLSGLHGLPAVSPARSVHPRITTATAIGA